MTIPVCVFVVGKKVHRTEFIFLKWLFFFESMNESHTLMIGIFYFESKTTTTTTTKKRGHNISMYYLFVAKTKRLMIPIFSIFPIVFILL